MDLQEIKDLRRHLEERIAEDVLSFSTATGVRVESVKCDLLAHRADGTATAYRVNVAINF